MFSHTTVIFVLLFLIAYNWIVNISLMTSKLIEVDRLRYSLGNVHHGSHLDLEVSFFGYCGYVNKPYSLANTAIGK